MWWWSNLSWTSWDYFWPGFVETRGMNSCCFTNCFRKMSCWHAFGYLQISLIQIYNNRYYCTQHFDTCLIDLDLHPWSQECEKAKQFVPVISQNFWLVWIEFGILLRLVDVMNLILISSHPFSTGENHTKFNIGLYSHIYRPISFRFGTLIETTMLYILISVWMALTFIQSDSCMRNQKLLCPFSHKF